MTKLPRSTLLALTLLLNSPFAVTYEGRSLQALLEQQASFYQ